MGIYYLAYSSSEKEYINPEYVKCPETDTKFCHLVVFAIRHRWTDAGMCDDVGNYYYNVVENFKDVTEEVCRDFENRWETLKWD